MTQHTVEKIGGSSMARTRDVLNNILLGDRKESEIYNRIFVVSAYGGLTDMLLEHKKTSEPGVYALFQGAESDRAWDDAIIKVHEKMGEINAKLFLDSPDRHIADNFVKERIEGARSCLIDLYRLCSYGHFKLEEHLMTVREMLSAMGEAHSAFNTTLLLQREGINARLVDLTGWRDTAELSLDERIELGLKGADYSRELLIATGYAQCREGLVSMYDRGYTEITFSRIAVLTGAAEAIIHKEYHLSSADPAIVEEDNVRPIGRTNYEVADQLSNLGMEAIHPRAAKGLRQANIPLRVMNTFQPDHEGTLIESGYKSDVPCVEIIAGRHNVYAIEFFDQDMVGVSGYDEKILAEIRRFKARIVSKDWNANTITHYVVAPLKSVKRVTRALEEKFPAAQVSVRQVALVSAIGTDMSVPGFLARAVTALAHAGIEILAIHQPIRLVDIQFIINDADYQAAVKVLHTALVETPLDACPTRASSVGSQSPYH